MVNRQRVRPGRLLAICIAAAAFVGTSTLATAAMAASSSDQPQLSIEQVFQRLQNTPVYKEACTTTCHGNIANTKNYASAINFRHGYHQLVPCASCHPRFPHRPDTKIERPQMKGCFDCHGVRHGPMGLIASGECKACHITPRERLRPAFHTYDWKGKPHVAPSLKELNTKCMMCHTPQSCVDCHDREAVSWKPDSWDYDPGDGCQACHGSATLLKTAEGGTKSFQVTGVDQSAHRDISCQKCHVDYRYDDQPAATKLWNINAGLACAECHQKAKEEKDRKPVADYNKSIHAEQIRKGNYNAATCASCHGGHFIYTLDTEQAKLRMHQSAYRVCARCKQHGNDYATYNDYYHGRAYKQGAADAPACWECHGAHAVQPSARPDSAVNAKNLGTTCSGANRTDGTGCHKGSTESFGANAEDLIHRKVQAQQENPLLQILNRIRGQ